MPKSARRPTGAPSPLGFGCTAMFSLLRGGDGLGGALRDAETVAFVVPGVLTCVTEAPAHRSRHEPPSLESSSITAAGSAPICTSLSGGHADPKHLLPSRGPRPRPLPAPASAC